MVRPLDRSGMTPPSAAASGAASPDLRAARFGEALAQAAGAATAPDPKAEPSSVQLNPLPLQPQMLMAADDAWVEVVAAAEELGNPALAQERKHMLLQSLAENLRSFQTQSQSIAQVLEAYVVREGGASRSPAASGQGEHFNAAAMPDQAKPIRDF